MPEKKLVSRIDPGYKQECSCEFEIPNYSLGTHVMSTNKSGGGRELKYFAIPRYYCPKCGTELSRNN